MVALVWTNALNGRAIFFHNTMIFSDKERHLSLFCLEVGEDLTLTRMLTGVYSSFGTYKNNGDIRLTARSPRGTQFYRSVESPILATQGTNKNVGLLEPTPYPNDRQWVLDILCVVLIFHYESIRRHCSPRVKSGQLNGLRQ